MQKRRPGSSLRCANWRVRKNNNPVQGWNFGKEGEAAMKKIIQMLFLMLIFAVFFCVYAAAEEDPLFIAQEGGKQGFINKAGEWVIRPEYIRVWPFTDAGYAAVETEEPPLISSFRLIDKQSNIVADLPDWQLDTYEIHYGEERQNAVGGAFLLSSTKEAYRTVLYLADTGAMIELDEALLGATDTFGYKLVEDDDSMVLLFYRKPSYHSGYIIMNRQGQKIHEGCFDGEPDGMKYDGDYYGYYIEGSDRIPSKLMYGWECDWDYDDETGYSYTKPDGELMYGSYVFDRVEPFCNDLARVKIMDETYTLLDAYIDTDGRIIWAENGKKDEVQRWLDEGTRYSAENITAEEASQILIGEWIGTGGSEIESDDDPIIYRDDGTWQVMRCPEEVWKEYTEDLSEPSAPGLILVRGGEPDFDLSDEEDRQWGWELIIHDRDNFSLGWYEMSSSYIRVAPGYWERYRQYMTPDKTEGSDEWGNEEETDD